MVDKKLAKIEDIEKEVADPKDFDYASLANLVEPKFLKTKSGAKHILPKFVIGMEFSVFGKMRKISKLLGRESNEGMYDVNTVLMEAFADEKTNKHALAVAWEMVEMLIGKDRKWVDENIDIMDMFEVVTLFFARRMGRMSQIMKKLM